MNDLQVNIRREGEGILVSLIGSLDFSTLDSIQGTFERLARDLREKLYLNLYECEFIDGDGINQLVSLNQSLIEQGRSLEIYVRPMSFVAFRTRGLPLVPVPDWLQREGEANLTERRQARLQRWRREKPIPTEASSEGTAGIAGLPPTDLIPIDFPHVAILAGKDERVVQDIWKTYCRLLDEGAFEQASDGNPESQLNLDSRRVAFELRLDWRVVRNVIDAINTHLQNIFGGE
jgi:anti-anti-sigma regulatory factor